MRLIAVCVSLVLAACNCASAKASVAPTGRLQQGVTAGQSEPAGLLIPVPDFDPALLGPVQQKFDERVAAGDREIWFRINSFGGSVFDGLLLIQHIEDSKRAHGIKTVCVVDMYAMSMGAVFLESGACDQRLMTKRSMLLFHQAASQAQGTADQLRESAAFLDSLNDAMAEICAARMKITVDEYKLMIAHSDWTMAWEDAVLVGAVEATVDPDDLPGVYTLAEPEPSFGFSF